MYTADHNQSSCMHAMLACCADSRTIMSAAHPHDMRTHGTAMCKCKRIATTAPTRRDSTGAGGLSSITPPIVSSLLERSNPRHTPSRPLLHDERRKGCHYPETIPPSSRLCVGGNAHTLQVMVLCGNVGLLGSRASGSVFAVAHNLMQVNYDTAIDFMYG